MGVVLPAHALLQDSGPQYLSRKAPSLMIPEGFLVVAEIVGEEEGKMEREGGHQEKWKCLVCSQVTSSADICHC